MATYNISIESIKIPKDKKHKSTSYQVASDPSFDDDSLVVNDLEDEDNKLDKDVDLDFNDTDVYYSRVKLHFDDDTFYGWTKPVIITKDGDGFSHNNTVIVTPNLKIENEDVNNCALGGFNVEGGKFIIFTGSGFHKYTDWTIRNSVGEVIWERKRDKYNLTRIRIPNMLLEPNKIYTIEARYTSSNNMKSNAGRLVIRTINKYPLGYMSDETKIATIGDTRDLVAKYEDLKESYNNLLEDYVDIIATCGDCRDDD